MVIGPIGRHRSPVFLNSASEQRLLVASVAFEYFPYFQIVPRAAEGEHQQDARFLRRQMGGLDWWNPRTFPALLIDVFAMIDIFGRHAVPRRPSPSDVVAAGNSGALWAVPWPCAHEFCAVISNQKWRSDALDAAGAVAILRSWASAPNFRFLGASHQHLSFFAQTLLLSGATGGQVHDARIAATCLEHDVAELWSADRDFSRFPGLRTRNPLSAIA